MSPDPSQAHGRFRPTGQQRGEDTRLRILQAALEVFAAEGYEGASTRSLAQHAGVSLPALQYYFGSKEGLYRAVIDLLAERLESCIEPITQEIRAGVADGPLSPGRAIDLLCRMLDAFVALVTDQTSPDWEARASFYARAEIESQAALDELHQRVTRQFIQPCALLVGQLIGQPSDAEPTLLRTIALIGQATVFCNRKARQALGCIRLDEDRVRAIQDVVCEHTRAIFEAMKGAAP